MNDVPIITLEQLQKLQAGLPDASRTSVKVRIPILRDGIAMQDLYFEPGLDFRGWAWKCTTPICVSLPSR